MMLKNLTEQPLEQNNVNIHNVLKYLNKASHTGALIYFISDFLDLDSELEHEVALSRLNKKCDVVFISVNDLADQSIYPVGTIEFSSFNEKEKISVNTDSLSGQEAYTALWEDNRNRLKSMTSLFKIPLIELTTESSIETDLVLGLKMIAKRKGR